MIVPTDNTDMSPTPDERGGESSDPFASSQPELAEITKHLYERYFLHYGVKAAATAKMASDFLGVLESGSSKFNQLIADYQVGGNPLSFSIKPFVTELGLPQESLEVSSKYWSGYMKDSPDRLAILPPDFISPMGYGVWQQVDSVPPQIFSKKWILSELRYTESLGAILSASLSLWERCYQKLEILKDTPEELPHRQRGYVETLNKVMQILRSGQTRESSLILGQEYFNKLAPPLKGRLGSGVLQARNVYAPTHPDGTRNKDKKLDSNYQALEFQSGVLPKIPGGNTNSSQKPAPSKVRTPAKTNKEDIVKSSFYEDRSKIVDQPKKILPRKPLERELVDHWSSSKGSIKDLSVKLRAAFLQGHHAAITMGLGVVVDGVPVVGGLRLDRFTLINEETETTHYLKYLDVRKADIFKVSDRQISETE